MSREISFNGIRNTHGLAKDVSLLSEIRFPRNSVNEIIAE